MTPKARACIQQALARSTGMAAAIYAYPLVEMLRLCRLHTSGFDGAPIDMLWHGARMPAGDASCRHTTAWIHLDDGPRYLWTPPAGTLPGCPYVLSFHDACSECIAEIRHEAVGTEGILVRGPETAHWGPVGARLVVQSPTPLVWLVCRTRIDDPGQALAFDAMVRLDGPPGTLVRRRPAAVELWQGAPTDAFVDIVEKDVPAAAVAPHFFANFARALMHVPCCIDDRAIRARFRRTGLVPGPSLDWEALEPSVRDGLAEGLEDAARSVCEAADADAPSRGTASGVLVAETASAELRMNHFLERAVAARRGPGASPSLRP